MFAVLFEVEPKPDRWDDYLTHAAALRPGLIAIDGFLDNRRFASRRHPGRLLSLSYWRDEKSVIRWRTQAAHHAIQRAGRNGIFRDYHLRVGEVVRDNGTDLPRQRLDATEIGLAMAVSVIENPNVVAPPNSTDLTDWEFFDGITVPGTSLMLLSWRTPDAMAAWTGDTANRRDIAIIRDYGLADRREAPQYHAPPTTPQTEPA